jgi:3-hydroxyacyl-[acyl-carrier-protein] dehydratase
MTAQAAEVWLRCATPLHAVEHVSANHTPEGLAIRATKTIHASDPYLNGHFPGCTIFPGVFIIENLRQAVAIAVGESYGLLPAILTLRSVRFLAPLVPGDRITLDATLRSVPGERRFDVAAHYQRSDGVLVAQLKVQFCYGDLPCD